MAEAPTYRERLQTEGLMLAVCGGIACVAVFAFTDVADEPRSITIVELLIVAGLVATLGPLALRRARRRAIELDADEVGSGEPTPLWHIAVIVAFLVVLAGVTLGPLGALNAAGGCVVIGFGQAILLATLVGMDEREQGRRFYRVRGSRILRGTRLGWRPAEESPGADELRPG